MEQFLPIEEILDKYKDAFDQPKEDDPEYIYQDDVPDQPFRYITHWNLIHPRSLNRLRLPKTFRFQGPHFGRAILTGYLLPKPSLRGKVKPVPVRLDGLSYYCFDLTRVYRGFWVATTTTSTNTNTNASAGMAESPLYRLYQPDDTKPTGSRKKHSQACVLHRQMRGELAVLGNFLDFVLTHETEQHNAAMANKSIQDIHSQLYAKLGHEPFDLFLVARHRDAILDHSGLDPDCVLMKSLYQLADAMDSLPETEWDRRLQKAEARSKQQSWGQPLPGTEVSVDDPVDFRGKEGQEEELATINPTPPESCWIAEKGSVLVNGFRCIPTKSKSIPKKRLSLSLFHKPNDSPASTKNGQSPESQLLDTDTVVKSKELKQRKKRERPLKASNDSLWKVVNKKPKKAFSEENKDHSQRYPAMTKKKSPSRKTSKQRRHKTARSLLSRIPKKLDMLKPAKNLVNASDEVTNEKPGEDLVDTSDEEEDDEPAEDLVATSDEDAECRPVDDLMDTRDGSEPAEELVNTSAKDRADTNDDEVVSKRSMTVTKSTMATLDLPVPRKTTVATCPKSSKQRKKTFSLKSFTMLAQKKAPILSNRHEPANESNGNHSKEALNSSQSAFTVNVRSSSEGKTTLVIPNSDLPTPVNDDASITKVHTSETRELHVPIKIFSSAIVKPDKNFVENAMKQLPLPPRSWLGPRPIRGVSRSSSPVPNPCRLPADITIEHTQTEEFHPSEPKRPESAAEGMPNLPLKTGSLLHTRALAQRHSDTSAPACFDTEGLVTVPMISTCTPTATELPGSCSWQADTLDDADHEEPDIIRFYDA